MLNVVVCKTTAFNLTIPLHSNYSSVIWPRSSHLQPVNNKIDPAHHVHLHSREKKYCLIKQIFLYIYCFLYCTQKYIQVIYMQSELMISTQFTLPWEMYTNVLHNMYRLSAILLISNQKKLPCTNAFFLALHKT